MTDWTPERITALRYILAEASHVNGVYEGEAVKHMIKTCVERFPAALDEIERLQKRVHNLTLLKLSLEAQLEEDEPRRCARVRGSDDNDEGGVLTGGGG